jgi:ADP-heptose:LPS heptosyltransferase
MKKIRNLGKIIVIYLTWLLFLIKKSTAPIYKGKYRKILILYICGMGDILCLTPFYQKIKSKFPDAELWACLPQRIVELENEFFQFNGVIPHTSYRKTLKEINTQKFDLIILPSWMLRDSILALISNAKSIIGYINEHTFSNRYLNDFTMEGVGIQVHKRSQDMRKIHLSERPNLILTHFRIEKTKSSELVFERASKPEDYIVVHAGARFAGRRWSPDNFSEIIKFLLTKKYSKQVYLIGDNSDKIINEQIIEKTGMDKVHDIAGTLSLLETKYLIDKAILFIGNDSGPMHIAALSGIPTIGLLGPNFPHISGPMGKRAISVFHKLSCTGCNQRSCKTSFECMDSITTEEVIQAVQDLLPVKKPK